MDFRQAEHRYKELQKARQTDRLDEDDFRFEVAKLLVRDTQGIFWMIDADSAEWYYNRGEGWVAGDPHSQQVVETLQPSSQHLAQTRRRIALAIVMIVVALGIGAILLLRYWPFPLAPLPQAAVPDGATVVLAIGSPVDGDQVNLGQIVPVESMISGKSDLDLGMVDRVELRVDGQTVDSRAIMPRLQPGQTSLPLSQAWRPVSPGEHQLSVIALTEEGLFLGSESISVTAIEVAAETLSESACKPDATFLENVTIPPGTAFPPGARMDKVWQMRNSGTCAWGVGYQLVLVEGEPLQAPEAIPVPLTSVGEGADLAVTFWAPEEEGAYTSTWQLQAADGQFFGPRLELSVTVEVQASEIFPPASPLNLRATLTGDGKQVLLRWDDQSDSEDAFRIYREDVDASIGLVPADVGQFIDDQVSCGRDYAYSVIAFNAAGSSPSEQVARIALPPCLPEDEPPALRLTILPAQVTAGQPLTVVFTATDDIMVETVVVWGMRTGSPALDAGRVFSCTKALCTTQWPITVTLGLSQTFTVAAVARDSSGQDSLPAQVEITVSEP